MRPPILLRILLRVFVSAGCTDRHQGFLAAAFSLFVGGAKSRTRTWLSGNEENFTESGMALSASDCRLLIPLLFAYCVVAVSFAIAGVVWLVAVLAASATGPANLGHYLYSRESVAYRRSASCE